jgi:hypothetical protein
MDRVIVAVAIVCAMGMRAAAQCCGDCNGDGRVTINELIIAVNNALDGCGGATPTPVRPRTPTPRPTATPTPNGCPSTFADVGSQCVFLGNYNRGCGSQLQSLLTSNGTTVIVAIDTMLTDPPVVYFSAQVSSPTSASLTAWSTDAFQTTNHPTAGSVQLNGNGSQLIIFPNDPPFMILGCNFVQYVGVYTGQTGALVARADGAGALERLRARLERPPPDLARPER